jgi:pimeloyl-ACP methyl ester carboxylesterase
VGANRRSGLTVDRRIAFAILIAAAVVAACGTTPGFTVLPGQIPSASPSGGASPASSRPQGSASTSASPGAPAPSATSGGSPGPSSSPSGAGASYTFVKKEKCPESRFECVTLSVPRDHTAQGGPSWDLTFAIQRATGTRLGTFVTVTGGPGYSGLAASEPYTDGYDPTIPEHYDMVFFDQRGIGLSHPIQCPSATAVYYADTSDPADPAQRSAVASAARTYVDACMAESKADPADLPYYATSQAIEDLEAFRDYLGADQLMLYGESYGTQFVQTYAAAHPDRIKALFIDGPVDLVPDAITYYTESARAFDDVLHDTLQACRARVACRADIRGGDPSAAYDGLAAKLDAAPLTYRFPTARGTFVARHLTLTDLQNLAYAYAYGPDDRAQFLRDLAAATQGDYVPMARAAYDSIVVDPETLEAIPDPTYSDAMYFATECQDYAFYLGAGSPDARLNAWLDAGEKLGVNKLRLGSTFYGDIPCVFWPAQPKTDPRPKPIVDPPYPTFIMTATADVATPIANAMRLFGRLKDAYLLEAIGGDHVIFGRGDECPDRIITDYLVAGSLPATRVTACPNDVVDPYVPNARARSADYRDALTLMSSMEAQITASDDYTYRLDADPITMGCNFGGTLTYRPVKDGTQLTLERCTFTRGAPMTGSGKINDDAGTFRLTIRLLGPNRLTYLDDANGVKSVRGTFRGQAVNLRR